MANPIEVNYQTGRTVYCIRVSLTSGATPSVYNTVSQIFETYASGHWSQYVIALSEVIPGYYRATCPDASLSTPATEIFYEQQAGSPSTSDAPAIANGNSQGVNIGTINGVLSDIGNNPSASVDVCNLALHHLGQPEISTLSDNVESARILNKIFNNCRDELLRAASWKFATIVVVLTQLPNETAVGWSYVYTLPTDSVFIRKVFADDSNRFDLPVFPNSAPFLIPDTDPLPIPYRVLYQSDLSAQVIVCNANPAYIEYTARIADPTLWDSVFKKALSYKLAAELAIPLNGDKEAAKTHQQNLALTLSEAAATNALETGINQRKKSAYLDVR